MEPTRGLELPTFRLQVGCATNCATPARRTDCDHGSGIGHRAQSGTGRSPTDSTKRPSVIRSSAKPTDCAGVDGGVYRVALPNSVRNSATPEPKVRQHRVPRIHLTFTRIVRHVPAGERKSPHHGYRHVRQGLPDLPGHRRGPRSTSSTFRSATASSSSWSARPVVASPPACGCSPVSRTSTTARSTSTTRDVTNLPPKARDIAMVFQNYALYPHMTVYENMAFALKLRKTPEVGDRPPGQGGRAPAAAGRVPRPQAEGALRWSAPACRHGPRHRA